VTRLGGNRPLRTPEELLERVTPEPDVSAGVKVLLERISTHVTIVGTLNAWNSTGAGFARFGRSGLRRGMRSGDHDTQIEGRVSGVHPTRPNTSGANLCIRCSTVRAADRESVILDRASEFRHSDQSNSFLNLPGVRTPARHAFWG
jgi:hypothetical protein